MKDGLGADDIWVMVEDEFNGTAGMFTRHIHVAEYKRLKQRAKSHNAAAKQQKAFEPYAESEDSDDEPWSQNPVLAEMMSQPKEVSSRLASVAGVKSSTRAALGYAKAKPNASEFDTTRTVPPPKNAKKPDHQTYRTLPLEEDDEDDDLDGISYSATPKRRNEQSKELTTTSKRPPKANKRHSPDPEKENRLYHSSRVRTPQPDMAPRASKKSAVSDSSTSHQDRPSMPDPFEDFPLGRVAPSSYSERMVKRKAEAAKKEQDSKRKSVSLDQIPTFLI